MIRKKNITDICIENVDFWDGYICSENPDKEYIDKDDLILFITDNINEDGSLDGVKLLKNLNSDLKPLIKNS